jgi:hypothetical protein
MEQAPGNQGSHLRYNKNVKYIQGLLYIPRAGTIVSFAPVDCCVKSVNLWEKFRARQPPSKP